MRPLRPSAVELPKGALGRPDAQGIMEAVSANRADGLDHWKVNVTGESPST